MHSGWLHNWAISLLENLSKDLRESFAYKYCLVMFNCSIYMFLYFFLQPFAPNEKFIGGIFTGNRVSLFANALYSAIISSFHFWDYSARCMSGGTSSTSTQYAFGLHTLAFLIATIPCVLTGAVILWDSYLHCPEMQLADQYTLAYSTWVVTLAGWTDAGEPTPIENWGDSP